MKLLETMIAAALLAGCRSNQPSSTGIIVLAASPPEDFVDVEHLFVLEAHDERFEILDGEHAGKTLLRRFAPTDQFNAQWAITEEVEGHQKLRTQFVSRDRDGDIVMPAVIEHGENALTLFEPPLILAPERLEAGATHAQKVSMKVLDAHTQRPRESGSAEQTILYDADTRIQTPRGELTARRIVITFRADLRFAEAKDVTIWFLAPEDGLVAETVEQKIRILGTIGRSSNRSILRAPH